MLRWKKILLTLAEIRLQHYLGSIYAKWLDWSLNIRKFVFWYLCWYLIGWSWQTIYFEDIFTAIFWSWPHHWLANFTITVHMSSFNHHVSSFALIKRTVDISCILSDFHIFGLFLNNFDWFPWIQHVNLKCLEQLVIIQYPQGMFKNVLLNKMKQ